MDKGERFESRVNDFCVTPPNEKRTRKTSEMTSKTNDIGPNDIVVDVPPEQRTSCELVTLIRKLRWIGMESEAAQLQTVLRSVPPDERASLLAAPRSTD
jgi:hypothetical protein